MNKILEFRGKNYFLSNFSISVITYKDKTYQTAEHFFQAMKADNNEEHEIIRNANTPGYAKQLGKRCKLKPDWEIIKNSVMLTALELKFKKGSYLYDRLVETRPAVLYEGNT